MFLKRVFNLALSDGKAERNPVREAKFFKEDNSCTSPSGSSCSCSSGSSSRAPGS